LTIRDITERKKAQDALEKAYDNLQREMEERKRLEKALMQEEKLKTLGAIAAEVAHEIRNPLVSIGGFAQRLKQKLPDLAECDIILNESQRLEKILSRITSYLEPVEFHPKECSVDSIITDCLNLLSPEIEAKQMKCLLDLAPRLSPVHIDPEILGQVFISLIHNAMEAMDEGGGLFIKSSESGQELQVEFKNQAPGFKVKYAETLLMPFAEGGQSFGLPLCYRLLKDMGGLLSFSQDNDFIIFTVSLPKIVDPRPQEKEL
jgi:signal transduction histidine kinase